MEIRVTIPPPFSDKGFQPLFFLIPIISESNDPDYLSAYYQGKMRRVDLLLSQAEAMLGTVKATLGTQESRLQTLQQEIFALVGDEGEF